MKADDRLFASPHLFTSGTIQLHFHNTQVKISEVKSVKVTPTIPYSTMAIDLQLVMAVAPPSMFYRHSRVLQTAESLICLLTFIGVSLSNQPCLVLVSWYDLSRQYRPNWTGRVCPPTRFRLLPHQLESNLLSWHIWVNDVRRLRQKYQ